MAPASPAPGGSSRAMRAPFAITGIGTSLADRRVTVEALVPGGGAAAQELVQRGGFEARHEPASGDVSPWHLASAAGRAALDDARLGPLDLDLTLIVGRMRFEYISWSLSLAVQKELGATKALGLDVTEWTGPSVLHGLRHLAGRFAADAAPRTALVACPHRFTDCLDPARGNDRWLWPVSDGGGALVVQRGAEGIQPLGHAFATEGKGSGLLMVRNEVIDDGPDPTSFYLHDWSQVKYLGLHDPDAWHADFVARGRRLLSRVVAQAVERSGLTLDQVGRVQLGFAYPELAEGLQEDLGMPVARHNAHGWMGGSELTHVLAALRDDASLRGKAVVLAGMQYPAHAGAMVLQL